MNYQPLALCLPFCVYGSAAHRSCPATRLCVHTRISCTYMQACMHTYIHTYTHTVSIHGTHAYIHIHIHTYIRTYIHTYIHTYIQSYNHTIIQYIYLWCACMVTYTTKLVNQHTYTCKYVRTNVRTYVSRYLCMYSCMCVYIYTTPTGF